MNIVIFGANGRTGQILTKQALDSGHTVRAFTRHAERFHLSHERLQVMSGNVLDLSSVEQAIASQDAVLSTLGVPFGFKKITLYSQSITQIIQAMKRSGVRRLVCVSSSGTDPADRFHDTGGGFIFEKIFKPIIVYTIGRTLYTDMYKMETLVKNSNLDWTIVRPSGLFETPGVTHYQVAQDTIRGRFTSRTDLADFMLKQLTDDQYMRKAVAIATFDVTPSLFDFLAKEVFKRESH